MIDLLSETLWAVFVVSIAGGILLRLMPMRSKLLPYIQFLLSLILLLMLLSPLERMLSGLLADDPTDIFTPYETETYGEFYEDAITEGAVMRASSSLAALLSAETGVPVSDMAVALTTEVCRSERETEITVTAATVTLFDRAHKIAAAKICATVERVLLCPCAVVVEVREDA